VSECAACGERTARPLYEVNGFPIVQCRCGLVRTMVPPGFDPAAIYTEAYFRGGQHDGYADYAGSADELRRAFRGLVGRLAERTGGGALIEVGSAYGYFLDEARARFRACGVEISDAAREECLARGLDVARELGPEVLAKGPFDAAVMLDVIEHLSDPGAVLARLHGALNPGAPIAITTGDIGSRLARWMGRRWRLMTPPQHLWFFSPATLGALLDRHGFRIETVAYPWRRVPLALVAYQASRYAGPRVQAAVQRLPLRGGVPINLFDAMHVTAVRI
jgi:SAM-dependent methyltransferase